MALSLVVNFFFPKTSLSEIPCSSKTSWSHPLEPSWRSSFPCTFNSLLVAGPISFRRNSQKSGIEFSEFAKELFLDICILDSSIPGSPGEMVAFFELSSELRRRSGEQGGTSRGINCKTAYLGIWNRRCRHLIKSVGFEGISVEKTVSKTTWPSSISKHSLKRTHPQCRVRRHDEGTVHVHRLLS